MNGVSIGKFPDIVGVDASILQPERQVVIVEALTDEFRVSACKVSFSVSIIAVAGLTPRLLNVCYVGITVLVSTNIT